MADEEDRIENLDDIMSSLVVPADPETGDELPEPKKAVKNGQTQAEKEAELAPGEVPAEPREPKEEGPDQGQDKAVDEPPDDYADVDIDEIPLEVMVDGKLEQVTIKDLKSKYSFVGAIDKRLQEVTEGRNRLQQQSNQLDQVFGMMQGRLQALDGILAQADQPTVDMDELRVKNPTAYLFERERIREASDRRAQVRAEAARLARQQEDMRNAALVEYSRNEAQVLAQKDPEFADPVKAPAAMKRLSEFASREFGYTPQEVYSVTDHRALMVLKAAEKWFDHEAKMKEAATKERIAPRPLMKPGVRKAAPRTQQQRQMDALRAKARESGMAEDVAATLIVRAPRR